MDRLTPAQADKFREVRKRIFALDEVDQLCTRFAGMCDHDERDASENCPVCSIYWRLFDAWTDYLSDLAADLDLYLESGPFPGEKR